MKQLVIIGANGHGKVIAEIAAQNGYQSILFLDDNESLKCCGRYPVVGNSAVRARYADSDFVIGIGNAAIRQTLQKNCQEDGLRIVSLVHPRATVASDVELGCGTVIMPGAIVNPGSKIGNGCIINTAATVDHDNQIEDFVHLSVGSHLAGTVRIGAGSWIGAGAVVSNNLSVCPNCMIGAGAVVIRSIEEPGTYVGVPARKIKP